MRSTIGRVGRRYPAANHPAAVMRRTLQGSASRTAAGDGGSLSNWTPRRLTWFEEGRQRETVATRANDLAANDAHAASLIDSIAVNTVGSGLWPQSQPNWKRLGI